MRLTVGQLAQAVNGRVLRADFASRVVTGVADLAGASAQQLSFCSHPRYREALKNTQAVAVLARAEDCEALAATYAAGTLISCAEPYLAMAQAAQAFVPRAGQLGTRHATAVVAEGATVAEDVTLGAHAVVEAGASIGAGCRLDAHAFVGERAQLGEGCHLAAGSRVLWGCVLGARVRLQAGAVVGSDGFGFAVDAASGRRTYIPQLGNVVLGDDVDVGANACIDRATFGSTTLGRGCKIDNLVQVAHNCVLGEHCVMTAQSGVAGSTRMGARVLVGAQGGIAGHATLADDVQLAARAGVPSSVRQAGAYAGTPSQPLYEWRRSMAALRRLPEALKRLARVEAHLGSTVRARANEESP